LSPPFAFRKAAVQILLSSPSLSPGIEALEADFHGNMIINN
jgi:hypothetical protein